ncbi:hypothetical protein ABIB85_005843, partial [Bradyrhizobium sp. JR1.5]
AVSSLGGFRTPAARMCRAVNHAAGIRNPSHKPQITLKVGDFRFTSVSRHL